jgi:hypothetical protein
MATTTMERMMMNDDGTAVKIESMAQLVCGYDVHGMNE